MLLNILLLEDDASLAEFLLKRMAEPGLKVQLASSCQQADKLCCGQQYDLYVLDRLLPDGDSFDWLTQKRHAGDNTPALFLTALNSVTDKVAGLAAADDYLVKPFEFDELRARIQVLVRRNQAPASTITHLGPLRIDRLSHSATINQEVLRLKPKEFLLLDYLAQQNGELVTRKMLLQEVWGFGFDPATNIVETYISRLRARLAEYDSGLMVETVRGSGYRLVTA